MIDTYLHDVAAGLHVRGPIRRRFLTEIRDHLADLAEAVGEPEAVERIGPPTVIAAEFDLACSTRRGIHAGSSAVAAIAATGASTLALIHAADPGVRSPVGWVVVFFLGAQVAAVCAALVAVQALRLRRVGPGPADIALLDRRAFAGIAAAALTMFAAGAAQPGQGPPLPLLGGPVVGLVAVMLLARSWRLNRNLQGARDHFDSPPAADLAYVIGVRLPSVGPGLVAVMAATCAFVRDIGERGSTPLGSLVVAGIEAAMVLAAYLAFRERLGLRTVSPGRMLDRC